LLTHRVGEDGVIDQILRSLGMTLGFLRRMLADVPDELMTKQVAGVVNHPAWTIGHLVISLHGMAQEMGAEPWLPGDWERRYGYGSTPVGERSAYPSREQLLAILADAEQRVSARLRDLGEAGLAQPLPDLRVREMLPTVGHAALHILVAHVAEHVGQLVVWRRVVGLGPCREVFV
jgi:hypothetical protein